MERRMNRAVRACARCGFEHKQSGYQGPCATVCNRCLKVMSSNQKSNTVLEYKRDRINQQWLTRCIVAA